MSRPIPLRRRAGERLLRAVAALWLPRFRAELGLLPRAADRSSQHVAGPSPVRVLVVGNGIGNAFGVRTQDLALPGALARALAERIGRGVEVDLDASRGMRVHQLLERLDDLRVWRYDAVVVTVGPTDAGSVMPLPVWRAAVHELVTRLQASLPAGAPVVLLGLAPMQRSPRGSDWIFDRVQVHVAKMDRESAAAVEAIGCPGVHFVAIEPVLEAVGETQYSTAASYAAIAERIAEVAADRLAGAERRAVRVGADDEDARVAALEASGLLDAEPTDRLVRLVRSARDVFGVRGAVLALVDRDELHVLAATGLVARDLRARAGLPLDRVLHVAGVAELGDVPPAMADVLPRLPSGPVRSLAGLAVEDPTGHAVGVLALLHDQARPPGSIDAVAMTDLVAAIQTELWEAVALRP